MFRQQIETIFLLTCSSTSTQRTKKRTHKKALRLEKSTIRPKNTIFPWRLKNPIPAPRPKKLTPTDGFQKSEMTKK